MVSNCEFKIKMKVICDEMLVLVMVMMMKVKVHSRRQHACEK